jgi:hypothetical protein
MSEISCNKLLVLESGRIKEYNLDEKPRWTVGRQTEDNHPDISVSLKTVSREQGVFEMKDGIWFYTDLNSLNGTYLNGKKINAGFDGRRSPKIMDDSFTLVFGSGDSFYLSGFLIFAVFLKKDYDEDWRIYDITNRNDFVVNDGNINFELKDLGLYAFKRTLDGMFLVSNNILFLKGNLNLFQKK